jgi:hypothetical protein
MVNRIQMVRYYVRKLVGKFFNVLSIIDHLTVRKKNLIKNIERITVLKHEKIAIYTTFNELHLDKWEDELFNELKRKHFLIVLVVNEENGNKLFIPHHYEPSIVFLRKNQGYDLAAVRDVLNLLEGKPKQLLLINSSVAWFAKGVGEIIESSETSDCIIGMVESLQTKRHIQSFFFLATSPKSVENLITIYSEMKNWKTKRATVRFGEIPILEKIISLNNNYKILFPYSITSKNFELNNPLITYYKERRLNPSVNMWFELLSSGFPGVKRNLFQIKSNQKFMRDKKSIGELLQQFDNL